MINYLTQLRQNISMPTMTQVLPKLGGGTSAASSAHARKIAAHEAARVQDASVWILIYLRETTLSV